MDGASKREKAQPSKLLEKKQRGKIHESLSTTSASFLRRLNSTLLKEKRTELTKSIHTRVDAARKTDHTQTTVDARLSS